MKATAKELALLEKILSEPTDPTASGILFETYYLALVDVICKSRKFKQVDEDLIREVVFDSLDKFLKQPQKFAPQLSTLESYLKMDAWKNMQNSFNRQARENKLVDSVEDWDNQWNIVEEGVAIDHEEEVLQLAITKLTEIFSDPQDFELAQMMICGVRETSKYAVVLGIENTGIKEQQDAVKRHKDRITKKLERSDWSAFTRNLKQQFL